MGWRLRQLWRVSLIVPLSLALGSCSSNSPAQPTTTTAPSTTTPSVTLAAPAAVSPLTGATSAGWPTMTVTDSTRTGTNTSNPLVYRFDIATASTFATIVATGVVAETPTSTSFTPQGGQPPAAGTTLFWRAIAIDPIAIAASPASAAQSFTYNLPPSTAAAIALQQGVVLWPGVQPPGTPGKANLGSGWAVGPRLSFTGVVFESPSLEELQMYDLIDRGMDPGAAINWLGANGYSTTAAYYPGIAGGVVGFPFAYMSLDNGSWDLITRAGA